MRWLLLVLALGGCGGTYDTQCSGEGGVDCALLDLPVCTADYGDHAPHAFCTAPCSTDDDCTADGRCVSWPFPRGARRVCVATEWLR